MAEPVRVRRLTDQEGQQLQQIVRRGSTNSVRYRRAMMLLASAGGVPAVDDQVDPSRPAERVCAALVCPQTPASTRSSVWKVRR